MGLGRGHLGFKGKDLLDKRGHCLGEGGEDGADWELQRGIIDIRVGADVRCIDSLAVVWKG